MRESVGDFSKAIQIDPKFVVAYIGRGSARPHVERTAFSFDPAGDVDRVPKHRELKSLLAADITENDVAGLNADRDLDCVGDLPAIRIPLLDRAQEIEAAYLF